MRRSRFVALAALLPALVGGRLAAQDTGQDPGQNPHGPLKVECSTCHVATSWTVVRPAKQFAHAPATFPLQGAHASTSCRACHRALDFTGTPTACVSCHKDVHQGELGADCARCHSARSFVDRATMLRQHQTARFVLTGSHAAVDCEQCHTAKGQGRLAFTNTPSRCEDCHLDRFAATRNPDHTAGGFSRDCNQCHATALWTPARFNHAAGRFPLTGAHRAVACDQCHANNRFAGTPTACVGCHLTDWQGTTNPSHQTLNFPQECTQCHSTVSWSGATFDHTVTGFTLTGQHKSVACTDCHKNGVFAGTPTTCVGCHQQDYAGTTNPNHQAAGFPTDCASCHTTAGWAGATFNHDGTFFPIYSGAHRGQWTDCATCHTSPTNFATFTCLTCHVHDKPTMDAKHQGRAGYTYDSQACYRCHPQGRAG